MNDRIYKFRAWDKHSKKMYSPEEIESIPNRSEEFEGVICLVNNSQVKHNLTGRYTRLESCVEIMQFTGLKDKNNKEIFEGDIVSCYSWFDGMDNKPEEKTNIVVEMKFDTTISEKWGGGPDGVRRYEDIEVIGNIFENPELIKECHV